MGVSCRLTPTLLLNLSNPLTPFVLAKTIFYQVGIIGFGSVFVYLKAFPWLKNHYPIVPIGEGWKTGYKNRYLDFILGAYPLPFRKKIWVMKYTFKPYESWLNHKPPLLFRRMLSSFTFFGWLFLRASGFIVLLGITLTLLTTPGWHYPFSVDGVWYDLVIARINDAANGAHISSYLGAALVGVITAIKFKDELLGVITAGFFGAIHEGFWIIPYYFRYAQYLDWSQLPNVTIDIGFSLMVVLLILSFWKYPYQKMKLKIFFPAIMAYIGFLVGWYLLDFHVTTLNNWKFGQYWFNATPWYADPLTNFIEVMGWLILASGFIVAIVRAKK